MGAGHYRYLQPQCQNLKMHVNADIGWRQSKISALRAKLDLDIWGEVNAIFSLVLAYFLLAMEFCGLWVEIHADPSSKLRSLLSLPRYGLALARAVDNARFASLYHP